MNEAWWYFWTVCFTLSGICFTLIALVVLARGIGDLRRMIRYIVSRSDVH